MSVLSAQSIMALGLVMPCEPRGEFRGMTYGLGPCGYDVTLDWGEDAHGTIPMRLMRGSDFRLAATRERFRLPTNVMGVVHDKSSWARRGLCVQNTVLEPGWEGFLTLELSNHGDSGNRLELYAGVPIAQVVFHYLDEPTLIPYTGKYQNQEPGPQAAR